MMHTTLGIRIARFRTWLTPRALWRRPFVRNAAVVAGGSAIAQTITVAFSPIITRLYGPEVFGALGVFSSVVATLLPVASLCYVHAIVIPPSDEDAVRLLRLSTRLAMVVALLAAGAFVPFRDAIATWLGVRTVSSYLPLVPVALFLGAVAQAYDQWLVRMKHFRASSAIIIVQTLAVNAAKIGASIGMPGAGVLITIATGGYGLHAMLAAWRSRVALQGIGSGTSSEWSLIDVETKSLAREYRDFPLYRMPQIALNSFSQNLPVLMLAALFGPVVPGLYAIGQRVLKLPATIISQSVGKVLQQRMAELVRQERPLQSLLIKTTAGLAVLGVVPFGLVIAFGPTLFGTVFGSEWAMAGVYARWMSLSLYFSFINGPSAKAVPLLALQGQFLALEVSTMLARVVALLVGAHVFHDAAVAVALFSVIGSVSCVVLIGAVIWLSGSRSSRYEVISDQP